MFILVLIMIYIGFTKVNRFLKRKLEFSSEFLVFLLFGEVFSTFVTGFILIVDFYVIPASLVELYYGLIPR